MRHPKIIIYIILVLTNLSLFERTCHALLVHPQDGSPSVFYSSPRLKQFGPFPIPTGGYNEHPVKGFVQTIQTTDAHDASKINGTIVFLTDNRVKLNTNLVKPFYDSGVIAMVLCPFEEDFSAGSANWQGSITETPRQKFPLFEVSSGTKQSLLAWSKNQSHGLFVSIAEDPNPWDPVYHVVYPIFGWILLLSVGFTLIVCVYKLSLLIWRDGFAPFRIAHSILWLNFIGNFIRLIWCMDPFAEYGLVPYEYTQILWTLSRPFSIGACLMIALYWHEVITRSGRKMNPVLDKMKWPFLAVILFCIAFEIATSISRAFSRAAYNTLVYIDVAIYSTILIGVLIFFTITRIRLHKTFSKINESLGGQSSRHKLQLSSAYLNMMTASMIAWIIGMVYLAIITAVEYRPETVSTGWIVVLGSKQCMSMSQVLLIKVPHRSWKWIICGLWNQKIAAEEMQDDANANKTRANN